MKTLRRDSGQIALILVLVMTVIAAATVALSMRTTVETRVQEINVDSSQAMLAAESGLEQALKGTPTPLLQGNIAPNTSFTATDQTVASGQSVYQGLKEGETLQLFTAATTTSVTIMWRAVGNNPLLNRAIYVSRIDNSGAIFDYAYYATTPYPGTGFSADDGLVGGYTNHKTILTATTKELDITILGGDVDLGFSYVGTMPDQLRQKQVVGAVIRGSGATTETVKYGINYQESINGQVPEIFRYALFSGKDISQ